MSNLQVEAEGLEKAAAAERVEYYASLACETKSPAGCLLLDVGCGNGYSIPEWHRRSFRVVGVDVDAYRLSRWVREHPAGPPLVLADAQRLPFPRGLFQCVVSSGMIEHVGVQERPNPYRIQALPEKDASRLSVFKELLSVVAPDGEVFVDCPNGIFPVDFWHGDRVGAFRLHAIPDVLLPSFRDFQRWGRACGVPVSLVPVGKRLRFRQVGRRWWGRLLRGPMSIFLSLLDRLVRWGIAGFPSRLSPFLVVRIRPARPTAS